MRGGGVGVQPIARTFRRGRVPQARIVAQLCEELVEHLQSVGPADVLRVQGHVEIAATLVLRRKLAAPVAQQPARHTGALAAIPARDVPSERQTRLRRKIAICAATATIDAAMFAPKVRSGSKLPALW